MSSDGTRRTLLESVLDGSFRPDRQGRLVITERLPAELPIEGSSEAACSAWDQLLEEQEQARELGSVNPWRFSVAVRRLHSALAVDVMRVESERRHVEIILTVGPLEIHPDAESDSPWVDHARPFTEARLRAEWDEWAHELEWDATAWAYWRFVRGFSAKAALAAKERERLRLYDEWRVEKLRQNGSIGEGDPFLMDCSPAKRRTLLRRAGVALN
jgi:hypothetical protein